MIYTKGFLTQTNSLLLLNQPYIFIKNKKNIKPKQIKCHYEKSCQFPLVGKIKILEGLTLQDEGLTLE